MFRLTHIEIDGFGPFAERQRIDFPAENGVVAIYGQNMRGKTSLLNAIRYALFGTVLRRGAQLLGPHTISNRERAARGVYGFEVALGFLFEDTAYTLVRRCEPMAERPMSDHDYRTEEYLRRDGDRALGSDERKALLARVIPEQIARFFLFDGELLQQYEELLRSESEAAELISKAIEQILGLPILQRGRAHLRTLEKEANAQVARDAQLDQRSREIATAIQTQLDMQSAHQAEIARLQERIAESEDQAEQATQELAALERQQRLITARGEIVKTLALAKERESNARDDLRRAMSGVWRAVLAAPLERALDKARAGEEAALRQLHQRLRMDAVNEGHCVICDQDLAPSKLAALTASSDAELHDHQHGSLDTSLAKSLQRMPQLSTLRADDSETEAQDAWSRIETQQLAQGEAETELDDIDKQIDATSDSKVKEALSRSKNAEEKLRVDKAALAGEQENLGKAEEAIKKYRKQLDTIDGGQKGGAQEQAALLAGAEEVFERAIDDYKDQLRRRVEADASRLFLTMTSEKEDYQGLRINDSYGLDILHRDGRAEDARSAGAEHVVALALMGALQANAPLRGPIVMDSPFGRLDDAHRKNIFRALPDMAEQVVLLVHEAEASREDLRAALEGRLTREYELQRVSARNTRITKVDLR